MPALLPPGPLRHAKVRKPHRHGDIYPSTWIAVFPYRLLGSFVVGRYGSKVSAVVAGRDVARANQPSRLVVHKPFGRIETVHVYQHDPFPPAG
ncbi:DUF2188 domain-containing protein [Plantactinospora sp. ZYX-F-223]|uniref:DUF2188 domain-containing protein n=1 Tax=Plantactinospora sp. ZYX-F-223 TaxID=3144103 RepID=UPI0031FCDC41